MRESTLRGGVAEIELRPALRRSEHSPNAASFISRLRAWRMCCGRSRGSAPRRRARRSRRCRGARLPRRVSSASRRWPTCCGLPPLLEPFHSSGIEMPPKPLDPFRFGGDGRHGLHAASPLLRAWASSPAPPPGRALATLRSKGCAEPSRALLAALDLAVRRVADAGLFSPQVGRPPPHTPYRTPPPPLVLSGHAESLTPY